MSDKSILCFLGVALLLSVEASAETALAVAALAAWDEPLDDSVRWLAETTNKGREFPAAPIGLYFASLWYSEKLYPVIFTVAALTAVSNKMVVKST